MEVWDTGATNHATGVEGQQTTSLEEPVAVNGVGGITMAGDHDRYRGG